MKAFRMLCAAVMSLCSGPLLAQPCEVLLSQSEIDYGQLNRTTLKAVPGHFSLAPRTFYLTVQCPQAQALQLAYRGVADGAAGFRFGEQGQYQLWLGDAQLDGTAVSLGQVQGAGLGVMAVASEMALQPEHALAPVIGGQPARGRRLTARVELRVTGPASAALSHKASEWLAYGRFISGGAERALHLRAGFTPASCTPRLGRQGFADFGRIGARQLAPDRVTLLQRSLALNVQCDGPTRFALVAQDNRAGSARATPGQASATLFGIGHTRSGQAIGAYRLRIGSPTADVPLVTLYGTAAGLDWTRAADHQAVLHHDGRLLGFVREGGGGNGPSALTDFTAQLHVDLYLAPLQDLRLDQEVPFEGRATMEIVYL